MWIMVLFDLPVTEKKERKAATDFRKFLLDNGFAMVQFSIYTKIVSGKDCCTKIYKNIEDNLPLEGNVDILCITDKQYENIISFTNSSKNSKKNPSKQLLLF